jgi:hypothetical protein
VVAVLMVALLAPVAQAQGGPDLSRRPVARPDLTSQPARSIPDAARRAEAVAAFRAPAVPDLPPGVPPVPAAVAEPETSATPAAVAPAPPIPDTVPIPATVSSPDMAPSPHTVPIPDTAVVAAAPDGVPVYSHPDADPIAPPAPYKVAGVWADTAPVAPRPRRRPDAVASLSTASPSLGSLFLAALRPEPRPRGLARRAAAAQKPAPALKPAPAPQPETVEPAAVIRPAPGASAPVSRRGSVCGVPGIQGETLAPVIGRVTGCGVAQPVRVTSVGGVRLSQGAIMDCDTAKALNAWVQQGLQPAFRGQVTGLQVAGHYVCRTRNHRKGARLSEHSKGKAIDISGIQLAGGKSLSILRDWRSRDGAAIKAAHKAACGIFGTTLGPGSDGMHEDHLHFDTARHRNGAYCR